MRRFGLVLLVIFSLFSLSAAQDGETRDAITDGGMQVTYPADYAATVDGPLSVSLNLFSTDQFVTITVRAGQSLRDNVAGDYTDAASFMEAYRNTAMGNFNDDNLSNEQLPNGNAVIQVYQSVLGAAVAIAVDLPDGELAVLEGFLFGVETLDPMREQLDLFKSIAGSIQLGAEAAEAPAVDTGEVVILDVPEGPLTPDQMPEGKLVFRDGVVMDIPEGWTLQEEEIENRASLQYGGSAFEGAVAVISFSDTEGYASFDDWKANVIGIVNAMMGGASDPEILEHPEGRTFEKYIGAEGTFAYYFIDFGQRVMEVQVTLFIPDADTRQAVLESLEAALRTAVRFQISSEAEANALMESVGAQTVVDAECFMASNTVSLEIGQSAIFTCPAGCTEGDGSIWGTDVYTDDSSVCLAAIHAGVITSEAGGNVVVTHQAGQDSYVGSDRNGIPTSDYGSWGGSFSVSAPPQ
jgi:hypothetical protein